VEAGGRASVDILEKLFELALDIGQSRPRVARGLQSVAVDYIQIALEQEEFAQGESNALVQKLRRNVGQACAGGWLQPDDVRVKWFTGHGGIPPECR
jgi:hypothetical protein